MPSSLTPPLCTKTKTKTKKPGLNLPSWISLNHNFNIDHHLNPFLPSGPRLLRSLPGPLQRVLGHRDSSTETARKESDLVVWLWAFVGAFVGVAVVESVFIHWHYMVERGAPMVLGSYGAAAILLYNTLDSPLAQPRNALFSQLISAVVGVGISKLFMLSPRLEELIWLAGALACALTSVLMGVTKTVHPPAGATALMAVVDDRVRGLGWLLVPVVLVSSGLMIAVALVVGNVQRRYPRYWWTAERVGKELREARREGNRDVEKMVVGEEEGEGEGGEGGIVVGREGIVVPEWIVLGEMERDVLEALRGRLKEYHDDVEMERVNKIKASTSRETLR